MSKVKPIKRKVVVFVGEKLAGKEIAAKYLATRHGFVSFRLSKILDDVLTRLHLPISRLNEMHLGGALRERFGGGVLAEVIKREIEAKHLKRIVIDGLRYPAEYEAFKGLSGLTLVYITAPLSIRYARAKRRGEKSGESHFSLQDFKQEEKLVTELFIAKLGRKARLKIVNDGSLSQLYQHLDHFIKVIK